MTFKVGDRVQCLYGYNGNTQIVKQFGTVINVRKGFDPIQVRFDNYVNGHTCGEKCEKGTVGISPTEPNTSHS